MFPNDPTIVDLSTSLDATAPVYAPLDPFDLEQYKWAARDGVSMERCTMATHTGTHIDAPLHYIPEGTSSADLPLSNLMGTGLVVDLSPLETGQAIRPEDVPALEEIEGDDVVMLHTGWQEYYGRTSEYLFEYPYLSGELAQRFADLSVKAVGIDTFSVGGWAGEVPAHGPVAEEPPEEAHLPLLDNDIVIIEELTNLDAVLDGRETRRAFFAFAPIRIEHSSGAPVRAFAIVE